MSRAENVAIEYRWAEGRYDRLPALAAELVRRQVRDRRRERRASAARGQGGDDDNSDRVQHGGDPVKHGLVASLNRPGGNVTGVSFSPTELAAKRLELLREMVPEGRRDRHAAQPEHANTEAQMKDYRRRRVRWTADPMSSTPAPSATSSRPSRPLLGCGSARCSSAPIRSSMRSAIGSSRWRHAKRLPAIYERREFAEAGGLMSYGTSIAESYRQVGIYAGRSSRATSRPTCRSCRQRRSSSSSISRPPRRSASPSRRALARADEVIE